MQQIETDYKPWGALGALYQGWNAADAQTANELDQVKQFLANQRETTMQPMDARIKVTEAAQAQALGTPEAIESYSRGKIGDWDKAAVLGRRAKLLEPFMNDQGIAEAKQAAVEAQLNQQYLRDLQISQDQSRTDTDRVAALQRSNVLGEQLSRSPANLAKERQAAYSAEAAAERAAIGANARIQSVEASNQGRVDAARITADASLERQRLANEARLRQTEAQLNKIKDIPASAVKEIVKNTASMQKVEDALVEVDMNPAAFGAKGYIPDEVLQRTDPQGVKARALIADIGSLKVHDRSGATVTAAEYPRLKPFIPRITDNPETIRQKLEQFYTELTLVTDEYKSMYSRERGYAGVPESTVTKPTTVNKQTTPIEGVLSSGAKFKIIPPQ